MNLTTFRRLLTLASSGVMLCTALTPAVSASPMEMHVPGVHPIHSDVRTLPPFGAESVTPFAVGKKVLSVGDSWAVHMEAGMRAASPGTVVYGEGHYGCGILDPVDPPTPVCNQWPVLWPQLMSNFHPDAVFMMVAQWDTMPQRTEPDAPARNLDDPTLQQRFAQNLDRALDILTAGNTPVYLMNSMRVYEGGFGQEMNKLLEAAALSHPNVHILDLLDQLCVNGTCPTSIDGTTVYDVTWHTTPPAEKRLGAWILNEMFQPGYRQ
jgi:hypothetical protein